MAKAKRLTEADGEYGEGSLAYEVTEPVDLAQLDSEIVQAMGWRKPAGVVVTGDLENASEERPARLWVTHENPKTSTITKAINAHEPDPETPSVLTARATSLSRDSAGRAVDIRKRLEAGESVPDEDLRYALIHLLRTAEG